MLGIVPLLALLTVAPADAELLAQAEEAYHAGLRQADDLDRRRPDFLRAAECYEELRRRGASNAALYRNQGNAYFLAGDLPRAILAYRRGLRLAPGDRQLQERLEVARELVYSANGPAGQAPANNWPPWLPRWTPRQLLPALAGCLAAAWIGVVRWRMTRRERWLSLACLGFTAAALLGVDLVVEERNHYEGEAHPLVVLAGSANGVVLHKGDGEDYPAREGMPRLHGGVEGRLLTTRTDAQQRTWHQIELAGGAVGWVRAEDVLVDNP